MKAFWKALGIAALAALVPVRYRKDEESGRKTFQSLLWKLDVTPNPDHSSTQIDLALMEGVVTGPIFNAISAKKEAALFADDEPDAAVVAADEAQMAADEAQMAADEAQAAADEAIEADFDPEF